nr:PAS domain S-box protein [Gammaproteobacteria bacterium]
MTLVASLPSPTEQPAEAQLAELQRRVVQLEQSEARYKRALKALRRRERRLRVMADAMPAFISYVDKDQCYRFVNKAYETWFGRSPQKIQCLQVREVLGSRAYEQVRPYIEAALSGREISFETELHFEHQGIRCIRATYLPHQAQHGRVYGFFVLAEDFTERRAARDVLMKAEQRLRQEQALREVEQHFHRMVDSLPEMIWMSGTDALCVYFNKQWLEFTGKRMQEELGDAWLENVHTDDRDQCIEIYRAAFVARRHFTMEYRLRRYDGQYRWVLDSGRPWYDADAKFAGFIGSAIDITERKQAEEALQRHRDELAHLSRLTVMGEMATSLAHELNQPLTAIVNYAEGAVLRLRPEFKGNSDFLCVLREITALAMQAANILRSVRNFVRKQQEKWQPVDVNSVVEAALSLIADQIRQNRTKLNIALAPDLPKVTGRYTQLEQVVLNLILNAIEATAGVTDRQRLIDIQTRVNEEREVEVRVVDNGVGLAAEITDQVFEPFFTTKARGLGMGLPICRTIVDVHHGRIWSSPADNHGACFGIAIPAESRGSVRGR